MYSCRMKRFLLHCFSIAAVICVVKAHALSFICVDMGDSPERKVADWLKTSTVTFSGEVIKLERVRETLEVIATFAVNEVWKGSLSPTIELKTMMVPDSPSFQIGMQYIVYAFGPPKDLSAWGCTGTADTREPFAKEQIKILGKGKLPEKAKS
jgi:hypothetical protein